MVESTPIKDGEKDLHSLAQEELSMTLDRSGVGNDLGHDKSLCSATVDSGIGTQSS